jgi:hypothetical protein
VDVSHGLGSLTSEEFIEKYVKGGRPLLLKNASHLFVDEPELFTEARLLSSPIGAMNVTTTSSGREISADPHHKEATDPLGTVARLFHAHERTVFFQAWAVNAGRWRLGAQSATRAGPAGDESRNVSEFAFKHLKRKNPLFRYRGEFNFLMANEGGVLPHSHAAVMNVLTQGAKRWTLIPRDLYPGYRPDAARGPPAQRKLEDWAHTGPRTTYRSREWYHDKASDVEALGHYDFVQEAGDAVFFPDGCTHATVDLCTPTVSLLMKGKFGPASPDAKILRRLQALADQGTISQEEFARQKACVLKGTPGC